MARFFVKRDNDADKSKQEIQDIQTTMSAFVHPCQERKGKCGCLPMSTRYHTRITCSSANRLKGPHESRQVQTPRFLSCSACSYITFKDSSESSDQQMHQASSQKEDAGSFLNKTLQSGHCYSTWFARFRRNRCHDRAARRQRRRSLLY